MSNVVARLLAVLLLVLLAPVIVLLGAGVLVSMGSPVLFRQQRAGLGGEAFEMLKLRSMRDARAADGSLLPDEERITAFGRFLRRSRLDELPGLINIVTGDLAFVGPRPLLPQTISDLGDRGLARGRVRPGLTGWSQVNGNTKLSLDRKIDLDLWYVEHRSLWLDFQILVRTLLVMVFGERETRSGREPDSLRDSS